MGSISSLPVKDLRKIPLPPLICVCCKSTYIEQTDGEDEGVEGEALGELPGSSSEHAL